MNIRRVQPDDAKHVFALVEAFATSFKPERTAFSESFSKLLDDETACLLVAEVNGEIAGYCLAFDHLTFYANGRVTWVEEIMVKTELRQNGIGRGLMNGIEAWAAERGSELVALATRRAAPFYLALGYTNSATFFRKLIQP